MVDAQDKYFDTDQIRSNYGDVAGALADRHIDINGNPLPPYESGTPRRGGPDYNDAYIMTVITLTYKLMPNTSGLPKF